MSSPRRATVLADWQRLTKRWAYSHPVTGRLIFEAVRHRKAAKERLAFSEFEPTRLLRRLKDQGFEPLEILDVGANRGEWTRTAASVFPGVALRLIEPQSEMLPFLEAICADFEDCQFYLGAAGAAEASLELKIWGDLAGSSLMSPRVGDGAVSEIRSVPVMTLDGLVEAGFMACPDLVKMDVQGFELEVMKGSTSLIGRTEIFILEAALMEFMEGRPLVHDMVDQMATWGYVLFDIGGSARRPRDGVLSHLDLCFARASGRLREQANWS